MSWLVRVAKVLMIGKGYTWKASGLVAVTAAVG